LLYTAFLCLKFVLLRRETLNINLTDYGFMPAFMPEEPTGTPARVTAVHRERYELVCEHGHASAILKSGVYFNQTTEEFPTAGDFVMLDYNSSGDSRIIKTLPRKTFFSRRDPTPGRGEQAVAANFDYVFIMQSLNRDFNVKRLERYLTIAWQSGAYPTVILTKADLVEDCGKQVSAIDNARTGVLISILRGCVIIVPMVIVLSAVLDMTGVWLSFVVTELIICVLSVVFIMRRSRKTL
jgi:hypothetical protein